MALSKHRNCTDGNAVFDTAFATAHKNLDFENHCVFFVNSEKCTEGFQGKGIFHLPQVFFSRIYRTTAKRGVFSKWEQV